MSWNKVFRSRVKQGTLSLLHKGSEDAKARQSETTGINLLIEQPPLFWFESFHQILVPGCTDLLPFSHMSISEAQ